MESPSPFGLDGSSVIFNYARGAGRVCIYLHANSRPFPREA